MGLTLSKPSVPEQIGVVGIDNDISLCELSRPTLSSVEPDFKGCGFIAAQALQRLFEKGRRARSRCRKLRFGVAQLVERASSRDLTGCQRIASAIERLIRETPLDELNFKKIVDTLHVSRRLLEIHYRKVFGRIIHQDIVKRRLLSIRKLLQTTRLPIGQIVEQCGYNTVNAAQVAYRRQFNEPMSAARNGKEVIKLS